MCGIAGLATKNDGLDCGALAADMVEKIRHRGPDDRGVVTFPAGIGGYAAGLGHCRLSIIDPAAGRQPIGSADQSLWLTFNGEIYNYVELRDDLARRGHRFATRSDSEVVLRAYEAYGERCVDFFRGMFAFAVWDARHGTLFLARDRFGEKPLFYFQDDDSLVFASEIKALFAFPGLKRELNLEAVSNYLWYRYVPAPETLFRGVRKLLPGTRALWQNGRLVATRYYRPPDGAQPAATGAGRPSAAELARLLEEAVRLRMRCDVPFGAFLSGGIDSSAIVAFMSRQSPFPVKTFSIGFAESGYNETDYARLVASRFRTDHRELVVTSGDMMSLLPRLIGFRDAPVSEPSDIPVHLLAGFARREVKMVLTGEGGDEIFAGYPKHVFERFSRAGALVPEAGRRLILFSLAALPYRFHRIKTALRALRLPAFEERMPAWFGGFSPETLRRLLGPDIPAPLRVPYFHFDIGEGNSALRQILFFDQTSWLPDNLLERGDRMTMACSLEARLPFLDHVLAAYVSSLPDRYRVRGFRTKWILREAMRPLLPKIIIERPKVGFKVPVSVWFRTTMREYLFDLLLGAGSRTKQYFRPAPLGKILTAHVRGKENNEKILWTLLNLELWHRQYVP